MIDQLALLINHQSQIINHKTLIADNRSSINWQIVFHSIPTIIRKRFASIDQS